MGCLLHLLCESAMPNIQMQKTGKGVTGQSNEFLSASDLERWEDHAEAVNNQSLRILSLIRSLFRVGPGQRRMCPPFLKLVCYPQGSLSAP
jgi:hypothetical protein